MVDELQYESPIDPRQLPKLDASGGDPILILRPSPPRWWYLCLAIYSVVQFCVFCVLVVIFLRMWFALWSPMTSGFPANTLSRDDRLLFIIQFAGIAFWLFESILLGTFSFRQYQIGLTPRRLWMSNGSIHLNHAGYWRVSTRTRDLRSIRGIRLKPIKSFLGGTAGAFLTVRFGRFRRWSFRFKQNQMPLAHEAQSRFARCLEQSSKVRFGDPLEQQ